MMELEKLNKQLLDYFSEIELIFSRKQQALKLECLPGCGACCLSPNVTSTLLEMLPYAIHLFQHGQADQVYEALCNTSLESCYFYKKESENGECGRCTIYPHRPLLCRVFGAFPRHDKWNNLELSVCKKIKQERPMAFESAVKNLEHDHFEELSFSQTWRLKLIDLRPDLGAVEYPINSATMQAITFASLYFRV